MEFFGFSLHIRKYLSSPLHTTNELEYTFHNLFRNPDPDYVTANESNFISYTCIYLLHIIAIGYLQS